MNVYQMLVDLAEANHTVIIEPLNVKGEGLVYRVVARWEAGSVRGSVISQRGTLADAVGDVYCVTLEDIKDENK